MPNAFAAALQLDTTIDSQYARIRRSEFKNIFKHNAIATANASYFQRIRPFITSDSLTVKLLSELIQKEIQVVANANAPSTNCQLLMGSPTLPLLQMLMQPSDNFVAEQLLLLCAQEQFGVLNTDKIIEYARDSLMQDLPDELKWVDGSGLSRYNLFTPRTQVRLLEKLYQEYPFDTLQMIFPAGGKRGTIQKWYGGKEKPYVYAKTGTMTGVHCLSGYTTTKRGKRYIFSFMHNNYLGSSKPFKVEMQRILDDIFENY